MRFFLCNKLYSSQDEWISIPNNETIFFNKNGFDYLVAIVKDNIGNVIYSFNVGIGDDSFYPQSNNFPNEGFSIVMKIMESQH